MTVTVDRERSVDLPSEIRGCDASAQRFCELAKPLFRRVGSIDGRANMGIADLRPDEGDRFACFPGGQCLLPAIYDGRSEHA